MLLSGPLTMLHSDLCVVRWTFVLRSGPTCIFVPVMRIKPSISRVLCLCFNNLSVVLSGPLSLDVYTHGALKPLKILIYGAG